MNTTQQNKPDGSESRPYLKTPRSPNDPIGRRSLPHDPPHFIGTSDAIFFVTICCQSKGKNQLCRPEIASILFEAARFYEDKHEWYPRLLLLMPDHIHLLASLGPKAGMKSVVQRWKRYTAKYARVHWQRDFFDHRLRTEESFDEKAAYILQNPVRAGFVSKEEDWPYQFRPR